VKPVEQQHAQLPELAQSGHEVIIEDPPKGKTRLEPVAKPLHQAPRIFGFDEGEVWMSDDFNAPLPDSFWLGENQG
jgi:hypothetical protein